MRLRLGRGSQLALEFPRQRERQLLLGGGHLSNVNEAVFGKVGFGPGSREGLSMDEYALFTISSFQNGGFTLA